MTLELEQNLIGTLLAYPEALRQVEGLQAEHFSEPLHGRVFAEVIQQICTGGHVSVVTVAAKIGTEHNRYLAACAASSSTIVNLRALADGIMDAALRRAAVKSCEDALQGLQSGEAASEVIAVLRKSLEQGSATRLFNDAGAVCEAIIEDLGNDSPATPTGIALLDKAMDGGMYPGKAYGFAARKKIGKTILASTISHNLNHAGVKHLFICGEMGEKEIHQRSIARSLTLYPSAFRSGYAERAHVMNRIAELATNGPRNAIYYDAPGLTFDNLKQAVGMAVMKHGIKGYILDYWQLVGGKSRNASMAEHLLDVAQWIADSCRKLGIWALVTAQINQDGNTRGGEGIRLAFDQIYQIHPEDYVKGSKTDGDASLSGRWIEMMDTRYTAWNDIGGENAPRLLINEHGPYFEEC